MSEVVYDWDWHPSNKAEAEAWITYDSRYKRENVAKSKFADESVIKAIAKHDWDLNDHESQILAALCENPNLTPELQIWLDSESARWEVLSQYRYWLARYGVNQRNSNFTQGEAKSGPTRSFNTQLLNEHLNMELASTYVFNMADHFIEQMWHDLALQKKIELIYANDLEGDIFVPSELGESNEEIIQLFSPGYFVTWVSKEEAFNFLWTRARAEDDEGRWHFEEQIYIDYLDETSYTESNLGMAIGAGVQYGDLKVLNETTYEGYLEEFHTDDRDAFEVSLAITKDSPWEGVRYRELSGVQQSNLAMNLIATLQHPFLGRKDGLSLHLIDCLLKHDETAESVKELLSGLKNR